MTDIVRSQFRIPKDLDEWLFARSQEESRSKNAQLVVELRARMKSSAVADQGQSRSVRLRASRIVRL